LNTQTAVAVEQQGAVAEDINKNIIQVKDRADNIMSNTARNDEVCKVTGDCTEELIELANQFWAKKG